MFLKETIKMAIFGERFKNAWNAFMGRDPTTRYVYRGESSMINPSRPRISRGNTKSIITAIENQIAVDCSMLNLNHVRLDSEGRYSETIDSSLNRILTKDANIDQSGRELIRDAVISLLDEGVVALVPFEMDVDPFNTDAYQVLAVRTGRIIEWYPKHISVEVYNEDTGRKEQLYLEKRICAIIENPFFPIMNEPNSLTQRLIRVLNQLDRTNEHNSSGKIDLLVQLPFAIKGSARRVQAETRRKDIEEQLAGSQHGIAYIDATEKVIQLNRSIDNNLWEQSIELTKQLFDQLGFSEAILNNSADEKTMLNYYNRIIDPIMAAIVDAMERKWISKTAQTQGQAIRYYRDPFRLVPTAQLAEMSDKLTRNEIMTSNEIRSVIGLKPSDDPKADELRNSNLNHPDEEGKTDTVVEEVVDETK